MARQSKKRVEPSWYYLEGEKEGDADACRFNLRGLSSSQQIDILATFVKGAPTALTFRLCFGLGVTAIENWTDEHGKPITNAVMFLLDESTLEEVLEVGAEVFYKSHLTNDEKKT